MNVANLAIAPTLLNPGPPRPERAGDKRREVWSAPVFDREAVDGHRELSATARFDSPTR